VHDGSEMSAGRGRQSTNESQLQFSSIPNTTTTTTATEIAKRQTIEAAEGDEGTFNQFHLRKPTASISISISFESRPPIAGNAFRGALLK